MAINIEDIPKQGATYTKDVRGFFQRRKGKAFRPVEVIESFEGQINENTIRQALRQLTEEGILENKRVANNQSWYYWAEPKE